MKSFSLLTILFGFLSMMNAQITVTNSTFPAVGDKLKLVENSNFSGQLNMGNVSGPQVWDFSALNSGRQYTESYVDPKTGVDAATFPDANMMLQTNGEEEYFKTSANAMTSLGLGGENQLLGSNVAVRYIKQPTFRSAPLTFIGATKSESSFRLHLSSDIFPDTLLASFGAFAPDSIRIEFSSTSTGLMDAFGTLKMQGKSIDVLREKSAVVSKTKVFLKVPLLGWQGLEFLLSIAQVEVPDFIKPLIGDRKSTDYKFYSNSHKEILVSARYDSLDVLEELIFADLGGISSTEVSSIENTFSLYPNPVSEMLILSTPSWKEGLYLVTIADISGKMVYAEPCQLNPDQAKQINVSKFGPGTFVLTVRDQNNTFTASSTFVSQ